MGRLKVVEVRVQDVCFETGTEESAAILLETPEDERTGWVFNPMPLQLRLGRKPRHGRPDPDWVGKVICRIGRKAGVVVIPADPAKKIKTKFASAHHLRRSCAQRLDDAGVPEDDVPRVMRHRQRETLRRHYAPGTVQKSARRIREYLATLPEQPGKLPKRSGIRSCRGAEDRR